MLQGNPFFSCPSVSKINLTWASSAQKQPQKWVNLDKTSRMLSHCSYFISYNSYTLHSITLHKIIYVSGLNEDKIPIKGYLFAAFKALTT